VGVEVTIHGTGFATASEVRFFGTMATFTADDDTTLRATVPAGASSGPISVTNPGGTAISATNFIVMVPPSVSWFAPGDGPVGAEIVVYGSGFLTASEVRFNGTVAPTFTVENDTTLRVIVPPGASSGPISVISSTGTGTSLDVFSIYTSVGVEDEIPLAFALGRNAPNPFRAQTRIDFQLPKTAKVRLTVYDLQGRVIRNLVDREMAAGIHQVSWDARDNSGVSVGSGIYLLRFEAGGSSWSRRMMRTR
jgi:hypothetical protein